MHQSCDHMLVGRKGPVGDEMRKLGLEWGATDFNRMLSNAAFHDNIKVCREAKALGATDFDEMCYFGPVSGRHAWSIHGRQGRGAL